jgi:GcrA cell cycle regulator
VLAVINRDGCRWPEGDPRKTDFRMCGAPRAAGRPYCEHHYERACERTAGRSASDAA